MMTRAVSIGAAVEWGCHCRFPALYLSPRQYYRDRTSNSPGEPLRQSAALYDHSQPADRAGTFLMIGAMLLWAGTILFFLPSVFPQILARLPLPYNS